MRIGLTLAAILLVACTSFAQQDTPADLQIEAVEIIERTDDFGQQGEVARGTLTNTSTSSAYTNINLTAEALNQRDDIIGEGAGVAVNACGAGLLFDFALQPGSEVAFEIPLETFETGVIDDVQIAVTGDATDPRPMFDLPGGMTQIAADQTVAVEWIDDARFRYGVGCARDLFSTWNWFVHDTTTDRTAAGEHPYADQVIPELAERLLFDDPAIFNRSALTFAPDGDRIVYQDAINTLLTANFDGLARYLLYNRLSNRTLQGIYWQPNERFLAYYFGAYGEPVVYFTANANSQAISPFLEQNPPSLIVPGVSRDARRIVVAGTFSEITGYFLYVVSNGFFELLFEAAPPGNNYPAPILVANGENDFINQVYIALDVDGTPHLQCFNRDEGELYNLAALPFALAADERAQWWMSPDERQIALAVDAASNGGMWLIDLDQLPACESGV